MNLLYYPVRKLSQECSRSVVYVEQSLIDGLNINQKCQYELGFLSLFVPIINNSILVNFMTAIKLISMVIKNPNVT